MTFSIPLFGESSPKLSRTSLALDAEQVLVETRIDERHVGDAVRDQVDLVRRDAVDLPQEFRAAFAHHHQPVGERRDLLQHPPLVGVRRFAGPCAAS